ncbi:NtaA/DmoA family FMN-dependent monooxygenase [bacterium RCC_150]
METNTQMSLFLFHNPVGRSPSSWRRSRSRVEELYGLSLAKYSAQRAEAAKLDAIFLADWLSFDRTGRNPDLTGFEPFTLAGALSAVTERIGIVVTASTTFMEPYNLARFFSQLDWLSNGRIGWNVVTSQTGDENFNVTLPSKSERYTIAEEFLDVVGQLWDGWDDDAVLVDREKGVWANTERIHKTAPKTPRYQVEGPLLVPRSPQGWPVLAQAGQSDAGIAFAAKFAEAVFTAQNDVELAQDFYARVKAQLLENGRDSNSLKIMPGIVPIIGDTEEEAHELANEIADLLPVDEGLALISEYLLGIKVDDLDFDQPVPLERLVKPEAVKDEKTSSRYVNIYRKAADERQTLRQLIRDTVHTESHGLMIGTAAQIADQLEYWFKNSACDGFTLSPSHMPEGLDAICDKLVPELQRRGLFRTEYSGETLRHTLGLERPAPKR